MTNPYPCLAGVQPKVTGYWTHGCPACLDEFSAEAAAHHPIVSAG